MVQTMGVVHLRDGLEPISVIGADLGIIGIVGSAPGANPAIFPYDTPVSFYSNDATMAAALGTTGTLADALKAIALQSEQGAIRVVMVRINPGANTAAAITAILGNQANTTGMWALLDAPTDLGITPRIIIIPGYTSQTENGVASITVSNGGSGYTADFPVTATGGSGSGFAGIAHVANGVITSIEIVNAGSAYATAPTLDFPAGAGTGAAATATLGSVANQICASIPALLAQLKAIFIPEGPTSSRAAAFSWLETLPRSARIQHPLRQDAKVSVSGSIVTKPLSPYIAALYARRDAEFGGIPSHGIANQDVNGLVGVTPSINLDITNDGSQGMADLADGFGIMIRGDAGVDGSLSDGGYVFWGTDTNDGTGQWLFTNQVRMRDYIEIGQIKAMRTYLGKQNISVQLVQVIINTLEGQLSALARDQHILGYRVDFVPADNDPENLRLGFVTVGFRAEEAAPFRKLTIRSRRYRQALTDLVTDIAVQIGTLIPA